MVEKEQGTGGWKCKKVVEKVGSARKVVETVNEEITAQFENWYPTSESKEERRSCSCIILLAYRSKSWKWMS